jgi:hypothetical protein
MYPCLYDRNYLLNKCMRDPSFRKENYASPSRVLGIPSKDPFDGMLWHMLGDEGGDGVGGLEMDGVARASYRFQRQVFALACV